MQLPFHGHPPARRCSVLGPSRAPWWPARAGSGVGRPWARAAPGARVWPAFRRIGGPAKAAQLPPSGLPARSRRCRMRPGAYLAPRCASRPCAIICTAGWPFYCAPCRLQCQEVNMLWVGLACANLMGISRANTLAINFQVLDKHMIGPSVLGAYTCAARPFHVRWPGIS